MSLVMLCVEDVQGLAERTHETFMHERVAQYNEWVEESLRTWWRPFGAGSIARAEHRVNTSRRWHDFLMRTDDPVKRVRAIIEVCRMTPGKTLHLSVTDWQLISERA